jgi:diguanylate cyclase (GGDEF)-like protein
MARTDPLTGLGNRLQMMETLDALQARAERYGHPYALALCDLDRFKAFNDALGHVEGDGALKAVARILTETVRGTDSVYRYGGEELLIVLPEQTIDSAELAGERLRRAVESAGLVHSNNPPHGVVTLSIGIAAYTGGRACTIDAMIAEADAALYEAKRCGRNRVATADAAIPA